MTDLKLTKLCAEAMGGAVTHELPRGHKGAGWIRLDGKIFNPLTDDAQAMALVKRLELWIQPPRQGHLSSKPSDMWFVAHSAKGGDSRNTDLNRAICECVANMQQSKK